jgi:cyclomaltodextrinase / maltogenic alpha-amylase / neopullulanase
MRVRCPKIVKVATITGVLALFMNAFAQMPVQTADSPPSRSTNSSTRTAPTWLTSGVIYEIFPRSFSPSGDLNGVTAKLDTLKILGVNILWLMPLHPTGQLKKLGTDGSPYAVRDYYAIDPAYGTKDDLRRLIQEAHRRQMKVIIDIVANHTAFDSVMMSHPEFYKHDESGHILSPHDWKDVAALNYSNPQLRRYMTAMLVYWIKEFDLDGYRCDAAGEVPTDFWEDARVELTRVKPDIIMLAEASKPELLRTAFDIDYSWPLMATLNNVIMHGLPASAIRTILEHEETAFPKNSLHMRMTDDHDEQRAIARYGASGSLAASALMFTLDGVPMIYNGMEAGDTTESGAPALFEPLKIYWQAAQIRPQVKKFYAFMIPLREQHPALWHGQTTWIHNSDEAHVVSFLRRSADEELLVTINLSNSPVRGTVEATPGAWEELKAPSAAERQVAIPALSLDAFEFRIFQKKS